MLTPKEQTTRRYPIGEQDFASLRNGGFVYVDKTEYVYRMTHANAKYMFLGRPRRFGKSLLTSTLHYYLSGRREMFKGLAIECLEKDWTQYPVIHIDMSGGKHQTEERLERYIFSVLKENETRLGIEAEGQDTNIRLKDLIVKAYNKTGLPVAVLIDEYDAPLLDVVHEDENLPKLRNAMRNFYSPLKACSPYLRYVFLTGITKFSQLSIFSELNNILDISLLPEYAAVCGISKDELLTQMSPDIDILAEKLKLTRDAMISRLMEYYDGYHFAWPSPDIFNPFSLVTAMGNGMIDSYWFGSGTPTFLIEMLRKYGTLPADIGAIEASRYEFDAPTETMTSITPLLYQSGYITIKDYDADTETYTLDIPNREIRNGLMLSLLPDYVNQPIGSGRSALTGMYRALLKSDMDGALRVLQTYLRTIPHTDNTRYEGHYQQVLYIIFNLMGLYCDVEVHSSNGRIDLVLRVKDELYLIELKMNGDVSEAINQINLKNYALRFIQSGLSVVKVGINFDVEQRTISEWMIVSD